MRALIDDELIAGRRSRRFVSLPEHGFRHALLREVVYATLTEHDRRRAHAEAGSWLEQIGERDPSVLARHYDLGGAHAAAARHYVLAAEQALAASEYEAARRFAERGLALVSPPELDTDTELAAELWSCVSHASFWLR